MVLQGRPDLAISSLEAPIRAPPRSLVLRPTVARIYRDQSDFENAAR